MPQEVQIYGKKSDGTLTQVAVDDNGQVKLAGDIALDASFTTLETSVGAVTESAPANATASSGLNGLLRFLFGLSGAVNETAPASDTASSGLNGRLQRIAQRITSLITLLTGAGCTASATFTPAAASHVANDCNGAAGTFALSAPSACAFMITDATLLINGGTAEATAWRLELYSVTPPSAYADDAAWDLGSGDQASYLGYIDLGTAVDRGSTQWVENHGINKTVRLAGTSIFGYLVNLTTLTPANVEHTVTITGTPV